MVAIVGTRQATEEARGYARALAAELAVRGIVVASGGAVGIDTAAHEGAMSTGKTLVVAPGGWNKPFPAENREMFGTVVEQGGGYLSICRDDESAQQHRFFERNGVLIAMSDVAVVVEAGFRSGAMNAASWAHKLQRPLFWVPAAPWNPRGAGFVQALERGWAQVLKSPRDIIGALRGRGRHVVDGNALYVGQQMPLNLSLAGAERAADGRRELRRHHDELRARACDAGLSDDERVFAFLQLKPCAAEDVCDGTQLPVSAVLGALTQLELDGKIARDCGLYLVRES